MMHPVVGAYVVFCGQFDCSFNFAGLAIPVKPRTVMKILDSFRFTLGKSKSLQKKVATPCFGDSQK